MMIDDIKIASGYELDLLCYPVKRQFLEADYSYRNRVLGELPIDQYTVYENNNPNILLISHKKLCASLQKMKEDFVIEAINHVIGHKDWSHEMVKGRGEMRIYPNRMEEFHFDDRKLLTFYPFDIDHDSNEIMVSQKVEKHYK